MAIDSSESINEVAGYDKDQKASTYGTMTFKEWEDLKSKSSMIRDFENIGPRKQCIDPAHKSDYSCVMYDGYGLDLLAFVIGLTIGIIVSVIVGMILMYVVKL